VSLSAAVLRIGLLLPADAAFAAVHHRHPLKGALIGGALGEAVQHGRNVHERHRYKRH
jgi:hypothetical protein